MLPVRGEYRGKRPVFGQGVPLPSMRSLLIVPLLKPASEDGNNGISDGGRSTGVQPVGALVVASKMDGAFDDRNDAFKVGLNFLQLIAGELATKLELAHLHDQLDEMATTDGLTGLNNHRTFQQAFDKMLARAERRSDPLCLIMADIDHFTAVNNTYGHPFGDEVLRGVAAILQKEVRGLDLAARYGGEEFALLLENSDAKGGRILGERIRKQVEQAVFDHPEKGPVRVTISLGLTSFPENGIEKTELIERADKALYQVKHSGRNRVACWSEQPLAAEVPAPEVTVLH
jgi:diguanylate cyclase (GGDEF)-like protein